MTGAVSQRGRKAPFLFEVVVGNGKNTSHSSDNGRRQNHPIKLHFACVFLTKPILDIAAVHVSGFETTHARTRSGARCYKSDADIHDVHWFSINGDEARPMFAFPGVWTRYKGPLKKNGENVEQEVFAFMTTEPNELTVSINHERMPVLLSDASDFETWLSGSTEEAFKLARSYPADQMRIVQSGSERKDLLAA